VLLPPLTLDWWRHTQVPVFSIPHAISEMLKQSQQQWCTNCCTNN